MGYRSCYQWKTRWSKRVRDRVIILFLILAVMSCTSTVAAETTSGKFTSYINKYCLLEIDDGSILHGTVKKVGVDEIILDTNYGNITIESDRIISIVEKERSDEIDEQEKEHVKQLKKKSSKKKRQSSNSKIFDGPVLDESGIRYKDGKWIISDDLNEMTDMQERVLDEAFKFLNKEPNEIVYVRDRKFKLTCIGTVAAIFYAAGINITKDFYRYKGNGVSNLYYILRDEDTLHKKKLPKVGDVVFWDNTWDRNKDKNRNNDPLTHIGIVVLVEDDGTIHYIHENYYYGIIVEKMNLYRPTVYRDESGKVINSPMYSGSSLSWHPKHWLAGDLFKKFGGILQVGYDLNFEEDD